MEQFINQNHIYNHELTIPNNNQTNELYQQKIQNMMNRVSSSLRCYLNSVTYIYQQNGISYSVNHMHKKFMRELAPPHQYLGFGNDEENEDNGLKEKKKIVMKIQNEVNIDEGSEEKKQVENCEQIFEEKSDPEPRIQDGFLKERKLPLFCGTNPTGISRRVKQFEKMKGNELHKQSSKMMRHSQKYFMNFEQRVANKNNPNKVRKRKPRRSRQQIQQQKYNKKNIIEGQIPNRKGRKISNISLQNKIYQWIMQQMKSNSIVKKIDIRHQFKIFSDGQYSGSTGWCRRFLHRHPEIQTYLAKQREELKMQKINSIPKRYLSSDSEEDEQNELIRSQWDDSCSENGGQIYPQNWKELKYHKESSEENSQQTTRAKR